MKSTTAEAGEAMEIASRLAAKQAIRELKARYFRCMDMHDWAGMRDVFAGDAVMDMREEMERLVEAGLPVDPDGGLLRGCDAIVAAMSASLSGTVTVHHGHMPEIELQSADEATGIWAMEDIVSLPEGSPCRQLHGYGHYHERYVRDDTGRWYIHSLRLSRLHVTLI
jgi:hypothetical protein